MTTHKQFRLDRLISEKALTAFGEAANRCTKAWNDMAEAIADALNTVTTELLSSIDWKKFSAAMSQIRETK